MYSPGYYLMSLDTDVFDWLAMLPEPAMPDAIRWQAYGTYVTAFRYARRCLWKGPTLAAMADDARKAADCFARLAAVLDAAATQEDTP